MAKSQKAVKAAKGSKAQVRMQFTANPKGSQPGQPALLPVVAKPTKGKAAKLGSIAAALQLPNGIAQQVAAPAAVVAKLTKRSSLLVGQTLVATTKPVRVRAPHVQAAWAAVVAVLPATSTQLVTLPQLAHAQCVSPQAFINYMYRRGYLAVK